MPAAFAMIRRLFVEGAVVVIENEMLAFIADDVRDALKVSFMFRDDEGARVESQHHSGGINVAALIVVAPGILSGRHSDVRRVSALTILRPVSARDEDRVERVIQACCITVTTRDSEKLRQTIINRLQDFCARRFHGKHTRATRRSSEDWKIISGNLSCASDESLVNIALRAGRWQRLAE